MCVCVLYSIPVVSNLLKEGKKKNENVHWNAMLNRELICISSTGEKEWMKKKERNQVTHLYQGYKTIQFR